MARAIEDVEKSMKRSNDKQLKIEHELCLKVCGSDISVAYLNILFSNHGPKDFIVLL